MSCLIVGLMGFGVHKLRRQGSRSQGGLRSGRKIQGGTSRATERKLPKSSSRRSTSKTADLRKIYTEWIPHFESFKSSRAGEQKISEVQFARVTSFLLSQRFNYQELDKDDLITHALVADLVVEDDYSKALNWLGKLEESIPSCRISKCRIVHGETGGTTSTWNSRVQVPVLKKNLTNS